MNASADSSAGMGSGGAATEAAETGLVNGTSTVSAEPGLGLGLDEDKGSGLDHCIELGQGDGETVKRSRGRPHASNNTATAFLTTVIATGSTTGGGGSITATTSTTSAESNEVVTGSRKRKANTLVGDML